MSCWSPGQEAGLGRGAVQPSLVPCIAGGEPLGGIKKKKKKRKAKAAVEDGEQAEGAQAEGEAGQPDAPAGSAALRVVTTTAGKAAKPGAVSILTGKNYEEEFASEIQKGQTGQKKSAPWGSSFVPAPKILHGTPLLILSSHLHSSGPKSVLLYGLLEYAAAQITSR